MQDCLFCKIAHNEVSSEKVYENDGAFAFLDVSPRALGHTMVVPKKHAETLLDLPDENIELVFIAVKRVMEMLKKALQPDGFTVGTNQGKASGQVVEHLHVHIFPRWKGDGGDSIHSVVNNPPKETLHEIAERIRDINRK